ncbi:hypothetical protein C8J57DRAFT_1515342 [Mycena rebaudengoi]|nr:hypothetical protein C8J57DRAFT_1515342 [Mycena rebaudengoi]
MVLPWEQLTSISAQMLEPEVAADILRHATALVYFTCTLLDDDIVPDVVPPLLLLDALTAPALEHLTVSEHELGQEPISTITAFLSRSYCYSSPQSLRQRG